MKVTRVQLPEMIKNNDDDVSNVDTSEITDMTYLFYKSQFNQDISNWDASKEGTTIGITLKVNYVEFLQDDVTTSYTQNV